MFQIKLGQHQKYSEIKLLFHAGCVCVCECILRVYEQIDA